VKARGEKNTTRKTKGRCVNNIKMDRQVIGWGGVDWIGLAQDRDKWRAFVLVIMNFWVP
jgi:hypothetical protein